MAERVLRLNTFFLRNRGLKALAVIMAILAFYAIRSETTREESLAPGGEPPKTGSNAAGMTRQWAKIPVRAVLDPGAAGAVRVDPSTVTVSVSGRPEAIGALTAGGLRAFVDCTGLDPAAVHRLPVSVHLPSGLAATPTTDPAVVKVWWETPGRPPGADREGKP